MKTLLCALLALTFSMPAAPPELQRQEAKAAFWLLNAVRTNPGAFAARMPFLKEVNPTYALHWNDTLAKVAERKALDMATRNYFAHVDLDGFGMNHYIHKAGYKLQGSWLKKPGANYFESCNAGGLSGAEAVQMLLVDDGVPSLGHRKHLLGLDEWSATLVDVGIGYAKADPSGYYRSYTCILIAKHQ